MLIADAGTFDDQIKTVGWAFLNISTNPLIGDEMLQMFAAGYLEAAMTWEQIRDFANSTLSNYPLTQKVQSFLQENFDWTAAQVQQHAASDPYWAQVGFVLEQFRGLVAGYTAIAPPSAHLSFIELLSLAASGDIGDIQSAVNPETRPNWEQMSESEVEAAGAARDHCSALVKVTDNGEELFSGHVTWCVG